MRMFLLVLVLNKEELLEEVLENLVQAGVPGATILDSTGMGRTLAQADHDHVLAGLRTLFKHSRPHNKTIFSVIDSVEKKEKAINKIKETIGDFDKPGVGIMFTLPLVDVIGVNES
jgi:nitrogen regulatory protein P-II 1